MVFDEQRVPVVKCMNLKRLSRARMLINRCNRVQHLCTHHFLLLLLLFCIPMAVLGTGIRI